MRIRIKGHSLRYWIDPWYRKRIKAINKTLKYHYGPIIIDGLYRENLLMKAVRREINDKG